MEVLGTVEHRQATLLSLTQISDLEWESVIKGLYYTIKFGVYS